MASGVTRDPLADIHRPLRAHRPLSVASVGLYGFLRSRACETGENPVFDMDRLWSGEAPCIAPRSIRMMVVYLLHDSAEHMAACWKQLERSLAVDADVYHFAPGDGGAAGHSTVFLFSHLAPLVGPMTYREAQLAVEHYLGWCSKLDSNVPRWRRAERVTVELIPRVDRTKWFKAREKAFSDRADHGFCVGWGFHCLPPCEGRAVDLITDTPVDAADLLTDAPVDVVSSRPVRSEQGNGDRHTLPDTFTTHSKTR